MWLVLNFLEQGKAKLMGHSIHPGKQEGACMDTVNRSVQIYEKGSVKS